MNIVGTKAASESSGIPQSTIYQAVSRGLLKAKRKDGSLTFQEQDLKDYVKLWTHNRETNGTELRMGKRGKKKMSAHEYATRRGPKPDVKVQLWTHNGNGRRLLIDVLLVMAKAKETGVIKHETCDDFIQRIANELT